jgi:hypothetical protein
MSTQQVTIPKFDLGSFIRFTDKHDPIVKNLIATLIKVDANNIWVERETARGAAYMTTVWRITKKSQAIVGQLKFTLTREYEQDRTISHVLVITTSDLANIDFHPVTITKDGDKYKIRRDQTQKLSVKRCHFDSKRLSTKKITANGTATYMGVRGAAKMIDGAQVTERMIKFETEKTKIFMSINTNMQLHSQYKSAIKRFARESKEDAWRLVGKQYIIDGVRVDKAQLSSERKNGEKTKRNNIMNYIK